MSIKIRLSRGGRKNVPFYRINVANSSSPRDGKFLEKLGSYDPLLPAENPNRLILNKERAQYWLSVGALPSPRVAKLLCELGIENAQKYKAKFIAREKGYGVKKKSAAVNDKAKAAAAPDVAPDVAAATAPVPVEETPAPAA